MHCQQLQAVDVPKQSGPCPEPRSCLPVACSAPASPYWRHLSWRQHAGTLVLGAPRRSSLSWVRWSRGCTWGDWLKMCGEALRPPTAVSWLLVRRVAGESEEAERRTLSAHEPENPEEMEIALSLKMWLPLGRNKNKTKQKILRPALLRGKERRCPRRLLRKSRFPHLWVAHVRAASLSSWTT